MDLNIKTDKEIIIFHKDILTDNIKFSLFFNVIYYLCNNKASSMKKIQDRNNEDYTFQTIKEPQILMNTYKRLILTYTPEINPYFFAYDESKITNDIINMTDEDYKILKNITKTTRNKPNNKIELLRLLFLVAKKIYGGNVKRRAFSKREGKKNNNYSLIYFSDSYFYLCLKRLNIDNVYLCPYIQSLINNDEFKNININIDDINMEDEGEETDADSVKTFDSENKILLKHILPYDKIDISILKNDVLNA